VSANATAAALRPLRRQRYARPSERLIEALLLLCALSVVALTLAIVGTLVFESGAFFSHVPVSDFLFDSQWTPLFADAHFGIRPLLLSTLLVSLIAMAVALPVGLLLAIYLSEYAGPRLREWTKPALELISGIPTVVLGYIALLWVTPLLRQLIPGLPSFNLLAPSIVIGFLIVPTVASLAEDALRAVPMELREASFSMGASRLQTALRVVIPAALSGILAAAVLALSRAVGETMIVAIAAGQQSNLSIDPTEPAATITAFIAQVAMGDVAAGSMAYRSLYAAGAALFVLTLIFNLIGYALRRRYRDGVQ